MRERVFLILLMVLFPVLALGIRHLRAESPAVKRLATAIVENCPGHYSDGQLQTKQYDSCVADIKKKLKTSNREGEFFGQLELRQKKLDEESDLVLGRDSHSNFLFRLAQGSDLSEVKQITNDKEWLKQVENLSREVRTRQKRRYLPLGEKGIHLNQVISSAKDWSRDRGNLRGMLRVDFYRAAIDRCDYRSAFLFSFLEPRIASYHLAYEVPQSLNKKKQVDCAVTRAIVKNDKSLLENPEVQMLIAKGIPVKALPSDWMKLNHGARNPYDQKMHQSVSRRKSGAPLSRVGSPTSESSRTHSTRAHDAH